MGYGIRNSVSRKLGLGDYTMERGRYRDVLDMLHNESNRDFAGLTGMREAQAPPNDEHLKELISTLLSED